jgi:hypothetical protein
VKNRMTQSSERARARRAQRQVIRNTAVPNQNAEKQDLLLDQASPVATTLRQDQETLAALLTIDTIAKGSLLPQSFMRYEAYKQALLGSGEDIQTVVIALSLFAWDLFNRRPNSTLH